MSVAYIAQTDAGSGLGVLWPLLLLGGLMYFLIIRPQRKRTRKQQALSSALEVGDQVRTIGGLMGVIVGLGDDWVTLGIEEGRIRVLRSAVAARMNADDSA